MKVLVISDSHDHLGAVRAAVALATSERVEAILHCGDLCSPVPLLELTAFDGPVHVTFGNNDAEEFLMASRREAAWPNVTFHKPFADLTLDGARVALQHYPELPRGLAATGAHAAVFTGHTHVESRDDVNGCLLLNPGELMGWKGDRTAYTYDTTTGDVVRHVLDVTW